MSVTVAVNDANLFLSPWVWYLSGSTYARTNNDGAYLKIRTSGATSVAMNVDVSVLVSNSVDADKYPLLSIVVDGGTETRYQLTSSDTAVSIASSLSSGTHDIRVGLTGMGFNKDMWTTPVLAWKFISLTLDAGSLAAPSLLTDCILIYSDSILQCQECLAAGESAAHQDAMDSWGPRLATRLNAEYGQVDFGGQGYNHTGTPPGNVPTLVDAWDFYSNGLSRLSGGLLVPEPDVILCGHGTNDAANGALTTAVTTWLADIRAAAPSATIYCLTPASLHAAAEISAGVTAAADGNAHYVDHGVDLAAYTQPPIDVHLSLLGQQVYTNLNAGLVGVPMDTFWFNEGAKQLTSGGSVDWGTGSGGDTIKCRMVDESVTPAIDDTSITGYTAIGTDQTLASKTKTKDTTLDRIVFDAADAVFSSPGTGDTVGSVVVYKFVSDDTDSIPLFCLAVTPTVTAGTALTVTFDTTGVGYSQE